METSGLLKQSFSPLTVIDIRYGSLQKHESNPMFIQRMMAKYGLSEQQVKLIIQVDDDHIDGLGRICDSNG